MKKDHRLLVINRHDLRDMVLYLILLAVLGLILMNMFLLGGVGTGITATMVGLGSVRICSEVRRLREYFIKLENANRAERCGLAMPRIYEDCDDIREALNTRQSTERPPSSK